VKSRKTLAVQTLSDRELRTFLHDVANAEDQQASATVDYFFSHYSTFFPPKDAGLRPLLRFLGEGLLLPESEGLVVEMHLVPWHRAYIEALREGLRAIWIAEDKSTAEWRLFNLQLEVHRAMDPDNYERYSKTLRPPPVDAPINQSLQYLRKRFDKFRKCRNPDCKAPFFIADRGKQSYCSAECAAVAQKAYKRTWWKNNGASWREARRKKEQSKPPQRKTTQHRKKKLV
jgi:hypothetical protein